MKKTNILKVLMTLTLALVITGAFAQLNDPSGDYTSTDTDASHNVTIGATMPFWVEPDSYFNPAFEAANDALTGAAHHDYIKAADKAEVLSSFAWDITELGGYTPATQNENYVEVVFTTGNGFAAGSAYTLTVTETAPAPSSCPGSAVTMTINVVAEPTMSWTTVDQDACEPVNSAVVANIGGTLDGGNMTLFWAFTASNVDSDWDGVYPVDAAYNETDITAAAAAAESVTDYDELTGTAQIFGTTGDQTLIAAQDWDAINGEITIYTFTLEGVTDKVSRKSDYLGVYNAADLNVHTIYTQYGTSAAVHIAVRPAPATGPIYHISDNFGL